MKWRNQLLALSCLLVFLAFGVFYFRYWVVQKPFGIILFIGEGLDPARLAMARMHAGGGEQPLVLESLPYAALLKNYSLDFVVPDQPAAATALATGQKTRNGALGVDGAGNALQNVFELARDSGRMTGLVTNGALTDPMPAGFYAHTKGVEDRDALARTLVETAEIDIVLGGGAADFLPARKGGRRADDIDLLLQLRSAGYDLVQNLEELDAVPRWRRAKLFGIFNRAEFFFARGKDAQDDQPSLSDMVRRSIELLQYHGGGYVLVVNSALMGKAARENHADRVISETVELDRAVSTAIHYAGTKSMVIVCADVAIGGLNLNGFPPRDGKSGDIVQNAANGGRFTWATGPGTLTERADLATASPQVEPTGVSKPEPARIEAAIAIQMPMATNAAADVIALGTGLGADALQGTLENTAIFEMIRDNM